MGLEHLIARRRTVQAGGLRFTCRGPTVATVHLVLGLYGAEIIAARGECDDNLDIGELILASARALAGIGDWRARRVMESCVDGDLEAATPTTLILLAETCCALGDVRAIAGNLEIPDEAELLGAMAVPEDDGPDPQSVAVVSVAEKQGCSPTEVMDWPYTALCEVLAVYDAATAEKGNGKANPAGVPGIGVTNVRGGA